MNQLVKISGWLMALPVLVSLAGCPAMMAARIAKKASESSSSSDKTSATKPSTSTPASVSQ